MVMSEDNVIVGVCGADGLCGVCRGEDRTGTDGCGSYFRVTTRLGADVPSIKDWNPCATCRCAGHCFVICCGSHGGSCGPGTACCKGCPEQWHPDHPEGIDCDRADQQASVNETYAEKPMGGEPS